MDVLHINLDTDGIKYSIYLIISSEIFSGWFVFFFYLDKILYYVSTTKIGSFKNVFLSFILYYIWNISFLSNRPPCPPSILIIGWCSSNPVAEARG